MIGEFQIDRGHILAASLASALALFAGGALAGDLYVATDGVDDDASGRGSEATPYKTLDYAYSKAADSGDRIILKTGTYTVSTADTTFLEIAKGVTIVSATGNPADVVIKKAKGCVLDVKHADAILSSVTLADTPVGGGGYGQSGYILTCSAGTVTNCVVRDIKYGYAENWWPVPVSLSGTGLFTDSFFTNNTANSIGAWGVITMTGGTMRRCLVADNVPAEAIWNCDGVSLRISGGTAEDCVFTRNRANSYAGVKATSKAKVKNCLIWDNWAAGDLSSDPRDVYSGSTPSCFEGCTARIAINATCFATTDPGRYGREMKVVTGQNFTVSATRFIVPTDVTFTAVNGSAPYKWDFDGDGTVDQTTDAPTATCTYSTPGRYTPKLTCGSTTCDRPGLIEALGPKMYVDKDSTGEAFPYATAATAAKEPNTALLSCIDGQEVVLAGQTFNLTTPTFVGRAIVCRGESPDTTLLNGSYTSYIRGLQVRHPKALVASLAARGGRSAQIYGGDLYLESGVVSNCVFRDGGQGGGGYGKSNVHCTGAESVITHSWVTNNASTFSRATAGCLWMQNGARCSNTFIGYNKNGSSDGSGSVTVRLETGSVLENCTIVGNTDQLTGGVYANAGVVTNCVIVGNTATKMGAGYHDAYPGYEANFDHCVTEDVDLGGTNAQDAPANLFANYTAKDFLPAAGSKLVDKGIATAWTSPIDLAGTNRVMGDAIDIGALERPAAEFEASFTTDVLEGFAPLTVTFTAKVKGTSSAGTIRYKWDFDGDGVFEVSTTSPICERAFASGKPTVSLKAENLTNGLVSEVFTKAEAVNVVPQTLHVVYNNPNAAFPYDTEANAAKTINDAYDIAIDGCKILLHPGTHRMTSQYLKISKAVTIRGTTGTPADVTVQYGGARYGGQSYLFVLNNAEALIADMTLTQGNGLQNGLVGDEPMGGMVSNCVLHGYNSGSTWARAPIYLASADSLVTHCIITNCAPCAAGTHAGGILLAGGARAENCLVADCSAKVASYQSAAGGIHASNGKVVNCTVVNCVGKHVGGILNTTSSYITNTVIACCSSTTDAAYANVYSDATLQANFSHCATETVTNKGWICGTTNNLFRSFTERDYRPTRSRSPLYKKGVDVPAISEGTDLLGKPRNPGEHLDIGCYKLNNHGIIVIVE